LGKGATEWWIEAERSQHAQENYVGRRSQKDRSSAAGEMGENQGGSEKGCVSYQHLR